MYIENNAEIQRITLKGVLSATPYESLYNLDGFLSEEKFRKHLLVEGEEAPGFDATIKDLYDAMFSSIGFDNIIILHGYKGTGKTTLIREFIFRYENQIGYSYIDFHKAPPEFFHGKGASSLIACLLKLQFLNKVREKCQYKTLSIIKNNLNSFPISNRFRKYISSCNKIEDLLNGMRDYSLSFGDAFVLYMTSLFIKVTESQFKKDYYIVIFDNLDALDVEFVTPAFLGDLANVLETTAELSQRGIFLQKNPGFTGRFRFLFAVREGNYSLFNVHFSDRLRGNIKTINVPFYLTPDTQRAIINRRLSFYSALKAKGNKKLSHEEEKVISVIQQWVKKPLFNDILVNSFNGDYRKIIEVIFNLVSKLKKTDKDFWFQKDDFDHKSYGVFGTLIRGAIDYWFPHFIKYYRYTPADIKTNGYCQPIRMILNLVLNLSQGTISTYHSPYEHESYTDLYTISKALIKLYPCSKILKTIAELFILHKSWVHLLSIYTDFPIENEDSLINHLQDSCSNNVTFKSPPDVSKDDILKDCLNGACKEIEDKLRKVKIKITPAGIVYLKHLHIHFEFYSALAIKFFNIPAEQQIPLFVAGETALKEASKEEYFSSHNIFKHQKIQLKPDEKEGKIKFKIKKNSFSFYKPEKIINYVLRMVKNHHRITLSFYRNKFEKEMGYNVDKFLSSNYAFLYTGDKRRNRGKFHITRVITAHIDYIDTFRLFMIERVRKGKNEFSDLCDKDQEKVKEINKKTLDFLRKYINLLKEVPNEQAEQWAETFLNQIRKIELTEYKDMFTRVHLPKN